MARLDSGFERQLEQAALDHAEHELVGKQGNVIHAAVERVHERLREYGREFDYNVEPIIDSFAGVDVQRNDRGLTIRFGWSHEAFPYLEYGTSSHTVNGDPVLSFVWEERHDPPDWVREEYDREGDGYRVFLPEVEVAGVEETRAIRDMLAWLRNNLR